MRAEKTVLLKFAGENRRPYLNIYGIKIYSIFIVINILVGFLYSVFCR